MTSREAGVLPIIAVGRLSFDRVPAALVGISGVIAIAAAFAILADNGVESTAVPVLSLLVLAGLGNIAYRRWRLQEWDIAAGVVAAAAMAAGTLLLALPEYTYGFELNGIIHRSVFASPLLLAIGVPAAAIGLARARDDTPSARDVSRYPILLLPATLALVAYAVLLVRLISDGVSGLSWDVLSTAYTETITDAGFDYEVGLRNHIMGTLLLIGLTSAISIGPGIGAGIFVSEYRGPLATAIKFSTTMLRAISVFIIGVAALSLVDFASGYAAGDPISDFIRGNYSDANGFKHAAKGSFLTASFFLSLLVIPVIARTTEEGLQSVPRDIREGSIALGATEGHGLLRILLPWAAPNIITGLLLGAAEAAGSVAILLFVAGTGQHGVGPLNETTSLSFAILETKYGPKPFQDAMSNYEFTAALLLLAITLGLTLAALLIKQRFARRARGSLAGSG